MNTNYDLNLHMLACHESGLASSQKVNPFMRSTEITLTSEECKKIQKFMPAGYSLVQIRSTRPTKKKFTSSLYNLDEPNPTNSITQKEKRDAFSKAEKKIKEPIESIKRMESILNSLKKHEFGFPFVEPVDPEVLGISDYFNVIKEPMDFSKIDKRIKSGFYKNFAEFENDVRKIWDNALIYNKPNTQIYSMTLEISDYFQKLVSEDENGPFPVLKKAKSFKNQWDMENEYLEPMPIVKKTQSLKEKNDRPLSYQEKKVLSEMIRQLPSQLLWEVWTIVSPGDQNQEQEVVFDIDTLPPSTARRLEEFVKSKLQIISNKKLKVKGSPIFKETQQSNFNQEKPNNALNIKPGNVPQPVLVETVNETKAEKPKYNLNETKNHSDSDSFVSELSESDD